MAGRLLRLVLILSLVLIASRLIAMQTPRVSNAITGLQRKVDAGQAKLTFDAKFGYLPSVLKALNVSVSSQILVFSKSSFQLFVISPNRPRAIYFNDDTHVGWVPGEDFPIELSANDPKIGPVFYTLDQHKAVRPKFQAAPAVNCLVCHDIGISADPIPRLLMLSVLTDPKGTAIGGASLATNDRSPFRERWGGWYVTGTYGDQRHLGNMVVEQPASAKIDIKDYAAHADLSAGANLTTLDGRFDPAMYPSAQSDVVALMVFAHQTHIYNLMAVANYRAKTAASESDIADAAEPLVRAMLFAGEAPLTSTVTGTTDFAKEFSARGPKDSKGRSLHELDLQRRLMKYPLSYLVYSKSFDGMPESIKRYVSKRFHEVLSGKDETSEFSHLSAEDRAALLEILTETKPGF